MIFRPLKSFSTKNLCPLLNAYFILKSNILAQLKPDELKTKTTSYFFIRLSLLFITALGSFSYAQSSTRIEPPHWWVGFENNSLQLLVHHKNIAQSSVEIDHENIQLIKTTAGDSPNYLFVDLQIDANAEAGGFELIFKTDGKEVFRSTYSLKARKKEAKEYIGFDQSDAIYLITPDRFANGDPANDQFDYLTEKDIDRNDDYARHGGDIAGITAHLDYVASMGFTALWPSPLLINDMPQQSYHGYAMTDFYRVDPRFGQLEEYVVLAEEAQKRGIKLIMDQVANHCGLNHWWMSDLPFSNWVNYQDRFEAGKPIINSNHRRTTNQDGYASTYDRERMNQGWFVKEMPDLNQRNPFLATYLIQNSIWWIETLSLGGIRQDTYPYPDKSFMQQWAAAIMKEYPNFSIVGEEWSYNPLLIAYWQNGHPNKDGYASNLTHSMDFALQKALQDGLTHEESWGTGLIEIYEALANDFAYTDPNRLLAFLDNHDMDRAFTQYKEKTALLEMALATLLTLPRVPQLYYGTEILMENTEKPHDHGRIRTDFPGGWEGDKINAFTGEGLSKEQIELQNTLNRLLKYRKNSKAIQEGKLIHFAPFDGVYVLYRAFQDEEVVLILNKNENEFKLDLDRFKELQLEGSQLMEVIRQKNVLWEEHLLLQEKGAYLFTTKTEE